MRYFLPILLVLITFISCSSEPQGMNLTGTIKGLKKGTLYLQKYEDTAFVTVDSLVIDGNANFHFSEKIKSPEIYYLYIKPKDGSLKDDRIFFFGEEGDLNIQTNLNSFGSSARISGSKNDSLLREYDKLKQRYVIKNLELIEQSLKLKDRNRDSIIASIEKQQKALISNKYFATINFAINNKDYEVAPYLALSEAYNAQVKYLDTIYQTLSPKIKDSKYGKELESFIKSRKEGDSLL